MNLVRNPGTAQAEALGADGPSELFLALAGSQYLGRNGDGSVRTLTEYGCEVTVWPGWYVARAAGAGDGEAFFMSPEHVGDEARRDWRPA